MKTRCKLKQNRKIVSQFPLSTWTGRPVESDQGHSAPLTGVNLHGYVRDADIDTGLLGGDAAEEDAVVFLVQVDGDGAITLFVHLNSGLVQDLQLGEVGPLRC